jgi:DNA-binding Lrp family transcriptional regulator
LSEKKHTTTDFFSKQDFISRLTPKQQAIIKCLDQGMYQAMIARRLKISKTTVSRFCDKLENLKLIEKDYKDPLQRRAVVYRMDVRLRNARFVDKSDFTLILPHKIRFGAPIVKKNKKINKKVNRFAHTQMKYIKSWYPHRVEHMLFEMNHPTIGKIGLIVHPNSIEVYQKHRKHILAKNEEETSFILSMALREAAARFVQEQSWCDIDVNIGEFHLIGSPHYALKSAMAKEIIKSGRTHLQLGGGIAEVDNSLEHLGDDKHSEIEFEDADIAYTVDRGLRVAARLEEDLPGLIEVQVAKSLTEREQSTPQVSEELVNIRDAILNMNNTVNHIDETCNNVHAACLGGTPLQQQFNAVTAIVSGQQNQLHTMQQTLLSVVESMSKMVEKVDARADASDTQRLAMMEEILRVRKENDDLKRQLGVSS